MSLSGRASPQGILQDCAVRLHAPSEGETERKGLHLCQAWAAYAGRVCYPWFPAIKYHRHSCLCADKNRKSLTPIFSTTYSFHLLAIRNPASTLGLGEQHAFRIEVGNVPDQWGQISQSQSPEGKEASSRNSLKRGFTECKTIILQSESPTNTGNSLETLPALHVSQALAAFRMSL
jgi:hypothetical protein